MGGRHGGGIWSDEDGPTSPTALLRAELAAEHRANVQVELEALRSNDAVESAFARWERAIDRLIESLRGHYRPYFLAGVHGDSGIRALEFTTPGQRILDSVVLWNDSTALNDTLWEIEFDGAPEMHVHHTLGTVLTIPLGIPLSLPQYVRYAITPATVASVGMRAACLVIRGV